MAVMWTACVCVFGRGILWELQSTDLPQDKQLKNLCFQINHVYLEFKDFQVFTT